MYWIGWFPKITLGTQILTSDTAAMCPDRAFYQLKHFAQSIT